MSGFRKTMYFAKSTYCPKTDVKLTLIIYDGDIACFNVNMTKSKFSHLTRWKQLHQLKFIL